MIAAAIIACALGAAAGDAAPAADAIAAERIAAHLARLEARIDELEERRPAERGRGAYRAGGGPRIELGARSDETVLERLRRLDREAAEARAQVAERDRALADAAAALERAQAAGTRSGERAAALEHVQDSLVTAQQVLAERQARIDELTAALAAAELARLHAERARFQLGAAVLRVQPGQTAELQDIQESVRQQARDLVAPAPSGRPAAPARPQPAPAAHGDAHDRH